MAIEKGCKTVNVSIDTFEALPPGEGAIALKFILSVLGTVFGVPINGKGSFQSSLHW